MKPEFQKKGIDENIKMSVNNFKRNLDSLSNLLSS